MVTCGEDRTIRLWDYQRWRCELSHECTEEPMAVALHPTGFQLLVGFKERVRVFNVLHKEMKVYREVSITKCREIQYVLVGGWKGGLGCLPRGVVVINASTQPIPTRSGPQVLTRRAPVRLCVIDLDPRV